MALAEAMVEAAAKSGASCVKFQAAFAETLAHPDSPYYAELEREELPIES